MRDISEKPFSSDEENNIRSCGAVGFLWQQVAVAFSLDPNFVREQFKYKKGTVYELYMEGRMQNELEIRQAVLQSAKNGSTPAQQQMLEYYSKVDSDINDLIV